MRDHPILAFGGPDVLDLVEVPAPTPEPGQVALTVTAAAINRLCGTCQSALSQALTG